MGAACHRDKPTLNTLFSQEITLAEEEISDVSRSTFYLISSDAPVISGGTFLDRGDYFVAVAASCGRWRVESRESRRADTRFSGADICNRESSILNLVRTMPMVRAILPLIELCWWPNTCSARAGPLRAHRVRRFLTL